MVADGGNQVLGGPTLGSFTQPSGQMDRDGFGGSNRSSPLSVRACSYGQRDYVRGCDAYILKCDDHEAPPDRGAALSQEGYCSSLRDVNFAASDGLLQQAIGDPSICFNGFDAN